MTTSKLGYLVLWSIPDLSVSYDKLEELAGQAGFPTDYIPGRPNPRAAWEKATSLPPKGLKVDPPLSLLAHVKDKYGVEPTVKLTHRVISASAPLLVRHIVREVTIPTNTGADAEERASRQLDVRTAAILSYDTDKKVMQSISDSATGEKVFDKDGWTNGNVQTVIDDLMSQADAAMNYADGQRVREGIRRFMDNCHATLKGKGGSYFVPASLTKAEAKLDAFQQFMMSLNDYKVDSESSLTCEIYAVYAGRTLFEMRNFESINRDAVGAFTGRIRDLIEKVKPILSGNAKGKVAEKVSEQAGELASSLKDGISTYGESLGDEFMEALSLEAMTELLSIKSEFAKYKEAVGDDLQFIEDMVTIAQSKVLEAQ